VRLCHSLDVFFLLSFRVHYSSLIPISLPADPSAHFFFFFNAPAPTEIYTLSLHDALPIWPCSLHRDIASRTQSMRAACNHGFAQDRKSTRLNSSHVSISYAVFCLKKKTKTKSATCWCIHII